MNGRQDPCCASEPGPADTDEVKGAVATFTLPRPGQRALRFRGRCLAAATGRPQAAELWHDIAIYRTLAGRIVVQIAVCGPNIVVSSHVQSFPDLDAASIWLEDFNPQADILVDSNVPAGASNLADVLLHGLMQRLHRTRIDRRFRDRVSNVLWRLEAPDPFTHDRPESALVLALESAEP